MDTDLLQRQVGCTATIVAGAFWVLAAPPSLLLLVYADTWRGRAFALGVGTLATGAAALIDDIETGGAHVTRRVFPKEDHFLFLSRRASVLGMVQRWINGLLVAGG